MSDRLFDVDEFPEVPLVHEPRARKGPARGSSLDARFQNDYPPEWHRCPDCEGHGWVWGICGTCLGMGSVKRKARLLAGFRCERCRHPYLGKGDAAQLGRPDLASPHQWSRCDARCVHAGPVRILVPEGDEPFEAGEWLETTLLPPFTVGGQIAESGQPYEAEWRILTVHHLDGDKANLQPWNLAVLCQRDHLLIQSKVVMERVYPHEHSPWFRWHAAGYYAWVYLGERLTRAEIEPRIDELLALERG